MNIHKLEVALSEKISSASTEYDLLVYTKSLELLKNGAVFVVAVYENLPLASANEGKLYFIENVETLVWSDGTDWRVLPSETALLGRSEIFSWGYGGSGRLGDGTTVAKCSPVQEISSSTNWCQVSAGVLSSTALKTTGEIWSWGTGLCGVLGDGTNLSKCSPVREISSSTDWCQITSFTHASAIKTTGEIWSWGLNFCGALGDGTLASRNSPVQEISSSTNWCQVSAGACHSSAIKTTGEIWSWGYGSSGQLGNGATTNRCSPVREISSSTNWCKVSAGRCFTASIKTTGEIWSWGNNSFGQLGNGATTDRCSPVREISSSTNWCQVSIRSNFHISAIKTTGEIWSWGYGSSGQLGDGTTVDKCSPVREITSSTNWCQVSGGLCHTSALKTTGEIWSWGGGLDGRLGDGTTVSKCSPVREISSSTNWCQISSASFHAAAIKVTSYSS